ncbi:hypothetical protein [Nostoc sp. CALU 546]
MSKNLGQKLASSQRAIADLTVHRMVISNTLICAYINYIVYN